jgi:hypothetical protein
MTLDFEKGEFRAPIAKLKSIAFLAKLMHCRAASHKWWLSVKVLASLAVKARILHMAIQAPKFFL